MTEQTTYETITYTAPLPGVAQITLNRPKARNAQDLQMTYDLNAAFDRAAGDDEVKVIILAGSDPHFCATIYQATAAKPGRIFPRSPPGAVLIPPVPKAAMPAKAKSILA